MADLEKLAEEIGGLKLMDAAELVKILEEKLGVSAAAPVAMGMPMMGGGGEAAAVEEQTEFDVVLTSYGAKKIQVIKEVRALTSLGLKEAKEAVDGIPNAIMEGVTKEAAEEAKEKLEAAGGSVELK